MRELLNRFSFGLRSLGAILHLASPVVLPAAVIGGRIGLAVAGGGALLVFLTVAFRADRVLRRRHRAHAPAGPGIARSLERVLESANGHGPDVLLYPEPGAGALVVRSLGGRGTILLSQGLVSLMSEGELRMVLRRASGQLRAPGAVLRSICAVLAMSVLRAAPSSWVDALLLGKPISDVKRHRWGSPAEFLAFLVLYQYARVFVRLGGRAETLDPRADLRDSVSRPGASSLQLFGVEPGLAILPLESGR